VGSGNGVYMRNATGVENAKEEGDHWVCESKAGIDLSLLM